MRTRHLLFMALFSAAASAAEQGAVNITLLDLETDAYYAESFLNDGAICSAYRADEVRVARAVVADMKRVITLNGSTPHILFDSAGAASCGQREKTAVDHALERTMKWQATLKEWAKRERGG